MYLHPTQRYGDLIPGSEYIRSLVRQGTISKEAAKRLRWMDHFAELGNARLTCRYFGISAQTFYRWKNRFDPYDLTTLEEASRRPHRVRHPETSQAVESRILELRDRYPRWGKEKLAILLSREGLNISGSTVGRVMTRLKRRGVLVEPENLRQAKLARRRRHKPRYAVRKPRGYPVEAPGDLVQIDTLQLRLIAGKVRFQFSAWDMAVKFGAFRAYKNQTSTAAADFLHHMKMKFPFPIKAIQIDGGSEFKDQFEEACRKGGIVLFVNRPRCPEMNGGVERANRTSREEFYEVENLGLTIEELNRQLDRWAYTYNHVRPHRTLDLLTPYEYYRQWIKTNTPNVSLMY